MGSPWQLLRVANSVNFGITSLNPEVAALTKKAAHRLTEFGVIVEEAYPDLRDLHACFGTLRAHTLTAAKTDLLASHRDRLGRKLSEISKKVCH